MTTIRIIHASDLHWSSENATDIKIVSDAMLSDLEHIKNEQDQEFEAFIFSGDLLQAGDKREVFRECLDKVFEPILDALAIPKDRFFLCPGNHDVSRAEARKSKLIDKGLQEGLKDPETINKFIDRVKAEDLEALLGVERAANFYSAIDDLAYGKSHLEHKSIGPFSRNFIFEKSGKKIGVSCMNSAWRASGEADDIDQNRLILGERNIDEAIAALKSCDFKIAVFHHPLDWMHIADKSTSGRRLQAEFDLLCYGHLHEAEPSVTSNVQGTSVSSQAPSMFAGRSNSNGYHIIDIDLLSGQFEFQFREFIDKRRCFDKGTSSLPNGSLTLNTTRKTPAERDDQIELFLRGQRENFRSLANDHLDFAMIAEEWAWDDKRDMVVPPIVARSQGIDPDEDEDQSIDLKDILKSQKNIIFVGDRQVGKTSLLLNIANQINTGEFGKSIPVSINIKSFKFNKYSIRNSISNIYPTVPSGFDIDKAIDGGYFTFLVDNFSNHSEESLEKFAQICKRYPNNRWICFGTPDKEILIGDGKFKENLPEFDLVHIQELPRKAVRAITQQWARDCGRDPDQLFNLVIHQIVKENLPKTPYMVTLLLWGIRAKLKNEKINEAILLSNLVDHLLKRADFRQTVRGNLDATSKKIVLESISIEIKLNNGFIEENNLTKFLIDFFNKRRLPFIATDVVEKLIECGILIRVGGQVSFKYLCFQEYFGAEYYRSDNSKLEKLFDDVSYLDCRREIELVSGIRKEGRDIISLLLKKLNSRAPAEILSIDQFELDPVIERELRVGTTKAKLKKIRKSRLNNDQVDEIFDAADRRAKARGMKKTPSQRLKESGGSVLDAALQNEADMIDEDRQNTDDPFNPSTYMATVDLLGRVAKNSDFTEFDLKSVAVKRVLVDLTKVLSIMLNDTDAVVENAIKEGELKLSDDEKEFIDYIMRKFLFMISGLATMDMLASPSLGETFKEIFKEGDTSLAIKMKILAILEDINDPEWKEYWINMISDKSIPGFAIDYIIDRLFMITHTKALDDDQHSRVSGVIDAIEHRLGWTKEAKDNVFKDMRESKILSKIKENG